METNNVYSDCMKIPARIWIPVTAALAIAGLLVFLLWLQFSNAAEGLKKEIQRVMNLPGTEETDTTTDTYRGATDNALLHLRQGDLHALQGEWAKAEEEYRASAEAGGGVAALRKLAQAELQRRDIEGVKETIRKLRAAGAREEDVMLLEAILMLRTGELVQAKELLANATEAPQKHYGQALLFIIQGLHDQAKTELALVVAGWDPVLRSAARTLQTAYDEFTLFPDGQEIHLITLIARALAQVQECELALPLLVQVLDSQEDYRDAWIVQGYCELTTERPEQALASLERAYALDPEKPEIQYFLGRAYAAMQDHKNAITFYTYALTNGFEPEKEVRRRIAEEATELGDGVTALAQFSALANTPGADLDIRAKEITLLITVEKKEEAYSQALKATAAFPDEARAFELLGWAAEVSGRSVEARAAYEKALSLDPNSVTAKEKLKQLK